MALILVVTNQLDKQYSVLASSILNIIITVVLLGTSIALLAKYGIRGNFGKAWLFFVSFIVLWFVAERIWQAYEIVYQIDPWPSVADYFWFAGYPLYFAFMWFYLRSFKKLVSSKMLVPAFGLSVVLAASLGYYVSLQQTSLDYYEELLGLAYPVLDSLLLAPISIGLILFARGQLSFVLACMLFGMLSFVISDYGFLLLSLDETYHTGHVIDIPYLWGYLFFLVGAKYYFHIFRKQDEMNRFEDQEDLR